MDNYMNCQYLFVYGTLLNQQNEFGNFLHKKCELVGEGKFKGLLFNLAESPGAIEAVGNGLWVYGKIYERKDFKNLIKVLDDYEGFGNNQPQPNLFIRKLVNVYLDDKELICWIYLYNLQIIGFTRIESGIYIG